MVHMSDAVFVRRNNQVQDAIDGQNLKQALQLIEKRIKKGESTRFLKAWKAHILFLHADDSNKQRGITETLELCKAEPPTTDLHTLQKLLGTLGKLDGHADTRSSLWEKAARAKPQDLEIQLEWFKSAFESDEWKSAQKAAMSLQKTSPKQRRYFFWAILLSYLVANDNASSETDRNLFGTLAYRLISKAADDVPADPSKLPGHSRAIQTPEEVRLLIEILESQKRHQEAVDMLNSERLGLNSRIVRGDNSFVGLKAFNLKAGGMWEQGLAFVKDFYSVTDNEARQKELRESDESLIWELLVEATRNVNTSGTATETRELIERYLEFNPKSRNAFMACLDTILIGVERGEFIKDDLFSACKKFIDCHKHKLYLFNDLRILLGADRDALSMMLDYLLSGKEEGHELVVPSINALKIVYCLNISGSEHGPSKDQVEAFITRCMKLYEAMPSRRDSDHWDQSSSTIESQPQDSLCILAAMALLRTEETPNMQAQVSDTAVIRAAAILERLLRDSPHNYEARLLLVRAYVLLGAGSLALQTFSTLSIKHMQYETVGHNLYTRLATIHPHSAPPTEGAEYKDFDPQAALIRCLNFYRTSEITSLKFRSRALEDGSYVNAAECVDLRDSLRNSICRQMYVLDVRRAQRLAGGELMVRFDELARDNKPTTDQRKYDAFMDCEFVGKPSFEERMRVGPLPKEKWLASAKVTDQLFGILRSIALQKPVVPEMDLPAVGNLSICEDKLDQTESEKEAATIHSELITVATFMAGSKTTSADQADKALGAVENYMKSKKNELVLDDTNNSRLILATAIQLESNVPIAPTWRYLHSIFTLIETVKALSQLVTLASAKASKTAKLPKDRLDRLSTLVSEVSELIRSNTKALKQRVSAPGVLGKLVDLTFQGEPSNKYGADLQAALETTMDASDIEVFVGSLMESWEEALDGVMRVKL